MRPRPRDHTDRPAAGVHLPWARVPAAVRTWAAGVGGGRPGPCATSPAGSRPGPPPSWSGPSRAVFVKAVGTSSTPNRRPCTDARRRSRPRCRVRALSSPARDATTTATGWRSPSRRSTGGPPRHPWQPDELDAVVAASRRHARELTPSPAPALEPLAAVCPRRSSAAGRSSPRRRAPATLDPWARAHLGRLADAGVRLAGGLRGLDARPRRRALGQRAAVRRRAWCSSTGPTVRWGTRPSTSSPGLPRSCSRAGPPPEDAARPARRLRAGRPRRHHDCCWLRLAASSCRTRSGRRRPGCRPCGRSRPRRARLPWPGCAAGPGGERRRGGGGVGT